MLKKKPKNDYFVAKKQIDKLFKNLVNSFKRELKKQGIDYDKFLKRVKKQQITDADLQVILKAYEMNKGKSDKAFRNINSKLNSLKNFEGAGFEKTMVSSFAGFIAAWSTGRHPEAVGTADGLIGGTLDGLNAFGLTLIMAFIFWGLLKQVLARTAWLTVKKPDYRLNKKTIEFLQNYDKLLAYEKGKEGNVEAFMKIFDGPGSETFKKLLKPKSKGLLNQVLADLTYIMEKGVTS